MNHDFSGKTVIVTGGTGNLGGAVVQGFADAGANIAIVDLHAERIDSKIAELGGDTARFKSFPGDLTNPDSVARVVEDIAAAFGQIDVLAHAIGGYKAGTPVHETGVDVLDFMLKLNTYPIFLMGGAVAKHMVEKGVQGHMVFILAKAGLKGSKHHGAYTASKAAAFRLMESLAAELKEHGIAVNGVSPSTIDTPAGRSAMPNADFSKWVTPHQLTQAVMYLSTPGIGVYGTNLEVYGTG